MKLTMTHDEYEEELVKLIAERDKFEAQIRQFRRALQHANLRCQCRYRHKPFCRGCRSDRRLLLETVPQGRK